MTKIDTLDRFANKQAKIGVVGMGYVGLPLALCLAEAGFSVIGIDINSDKIKSLTEGGLVLAENEPGLLDLLRRVRRKKKCQFSATVEDLRSCDAVVIAVQTPLKKNSFLPDYSVLKKAVSDVAANMKKGTLVVMQSTIAPGSSHKLIIPWIKRKTGFNCGVDYRYAYVPERVMPGKLLVSLRDFPRIIGVDDKDAAGAAKFLYSPITKGKIDTVSVAAAEVAKVSENSYRFMEINFVNALSVLCQRQGVSFEKVRQLVNRRDNIRLLQPGAGVGGHCLPKDPWLLVWRQKQSQLRPLFKLCGEINRSMAGQVVELAKKSLKDAGIKLNRANLAILGYAYKEETDDTRETPATRIVDKLKKLGVRITIHDPYVKDWRGNLSEVVAGKDAVIVLTAHREYRNFPLRKLKKLIKNAIVIDGRQTWNMNEARRLGIKYFRIGDAV